MPVGGTAEKEKGGAWRRPRNVRLNVAMRIGTDEPPSMRGGSGEVQFPDGVVRAVKSWEHAVGMVGEWAVQRGRIPESSVPMEVGGIKHGVHAEPAHSDGTPGMRWHEFRAPSGRKAYVHTHSGGSRRASVERICEIPRAGRGDARVGDGTGAEG